MTPSSSRPPAPERKPAPWLPLLYLLGGGALLGISTNLAKLAGGLGLTPLAFLCWSSVGAAGLLARHTAPGERVWRFQWLGVAASAPESAPAVPHFECDACHTQFPLQAADAPTQAVADALRRTLAEHGHQAARVDLAVHGTCAGCREDGSAHHS